MVALLILHAQSTIERLLKNAERILIKSIRIKFNTFASEDNHKIVIWHNQTKIDFGYFQCLQPHDTIWKAVQWKIERLVCTKECESQNTLFY